jgi:hypothetical protein
VFYFVVVVMVMYKEGRTVKCYTKDPIFFKEPEYYFLSVAYAFSPSPYRLHQPQRSSAG